MSGSNLNLNTGTGNNNGNGAVGWQEKLGLVFPNPGTLIFLLTAVLLATSILLTGVSFEENIRAWGQGFIGLYPFCMEIILLFLAGYALAVTPVFKRLIRPLAEAPQSSAQAAIYLAVFSIILGWFNWGLGIVGGILLARETAKKLNAKGKDVSYPLLITSGCAGLVVWESGLSGIVPLYLAETGHFLEQAYGVLPISSTVLTPANIITSLILLVVIPLTCYLLHPKKGAPLTGEQLGAEGLETPSSNKSKPKVFAERLERSTAINLVTGLVALTSVIMIFAGGGSLHLKNYLFIILMLGIALRKEPMEYPRDFNNGAKFVWFAAPVLVMFAALHGVIDVAGGIGTGIANWLSGISSAGSYPVAAFAVAALSNLLVPVTGAQWILEGGFILGGASALNASIPATVMAFSYGAAWAKLVQVFFILSWFSITEVRVREVTKYFSIIALVSLAVFLVSIIFIW